MDHATPNLPSISFEVTSSFYSKLGFGERWRDEGWMILERDAITLEFFPYPDLEAAESYFSCCLRVDDLEAVYKVCKDAGLPERCWGRPRLHPPKLEDSGLTIAYMVDPDGTLIRLIQN